MSQEQQPAGTRLPLAQRFASALIDLDGVVYHGTTPVDGAVDALAAARSAGLRTLYLTNNASRTPCEVAALVTGLGLPTAEGDVVTSAHAAAALAARRMPGARVLMVGGVAMKTALWEHGLIPIHKADDDPDLVVQGFAPDVDWRQLAEAAYAVGRGVPWIVTNSDIAVPREGGIAPGNGALAEAVRLATGATPDFAGKPYEPIYQEALSRTSGPHLVIGDSLETDIAGGNRMGLPSLLVLTGITTLRDLLIAPPPHRPTFLGLDLQELFHIRESVIHDGSRWLCAGWTVSASDHGLTLRPPSSTVPTRTQLLDAARALCHAAWTRPDLETSQALATWQDWSRLH
ncbi:HAD-IIA family hydrolase [Nocardia jiangsuensis]|uniref:HAD-IIA family hydrolase n=1 Tax=Nocardia jiangsuensis TaxID=1691563 RepID=A0ABV8DNF6_9NOCA